MTKFKLYDRIVGWLVFAIAAFTYLSTIEPTASLWDCGEFIATAYKLEVGHPPGAPLFMMLQKVFSLLAGNDVTKVAKMMNAFSALASAFTILFLFWSITHIARRILLKISGNENLTQGQAIAVLASGVVGALAYTWSDTFWFSAVEAEVYALSSLFTALVFWLALKWEEHADEKHADKWLLLIAYLMGLSIGVHLLNLLVIPAIGLIIYFRKFNPTVKGTIITLLISLVALGFIQYGIIQKTVALGAKFDLLFVNSFGLPFNSGFIFYLVLLFGLLIYAAYSTYKKGKYLWFNSLIAVILILFGYFSYAMIPIRSAANPPIDENDPEDPFAMVSYLNREQYGDRPLVYGQYYDAKVVDRQDRYTYIRGKDKDGKEKYIKIKRTNPKYIFDPKRSTFFPRMYSSQPDHIQAYKEWGGVKEGQEPNFINNMKFFFNYQLGWMYFRYFMWNFAGKQNDIQGHGDALHGNWISGIKPLDAARLGPQDNIPSVYKNLRSRNKYYLLPLILGLIGLIYSYSRDQRYFWVILMFFFMTGIAIVLYLNQTPYQPRERDYAYAGSFYAFAIWIGLGVLGLYEAMAKALKNETVRAIVVGLVALLIPIEMAAENWNDHDRSHRYHARDFAYDYLNSCAPNAILFTFGDNDTFPLWYLQEVEGVRTDVRVVNLSLLSTDWYIKQMSRRAYESAPVKFSLPISKYVEGQRDWVPVYKANQYLFDEKYQANKDQFEQRYHELYAEMLDILKNSKFPQLNAQDWSVLEKGADNIKVSQFAGLVSTLINDQMIKKFGLDKSKMEELDKKTSKLVNDISVSYAPLKAVIRFVGSDDKAAKLTLENNQEINFIPTNKLTFPVDKQKVLANGTVPKDKANEVVNKIDFTLNKQYLIKSQLATLDILASFDWDRPVYFATSMSQDNYLGLMPYFQYSGFAYRLVPIKDTTSSRQEIGTVNTDSLYNKVMNVYRWGNIKDPKFNVDNYVTRTVSVMNIRGLFHRLASELIQEHKLDSAKAVLDKCVEELPNNQIPFDYFMIPIVQDYYNIGDIQTGDSIANILANNYIEEVEYFAQFKGRKADRLGRDRDIAIAVLQTLGQITHGDIKKRIDDALMKYYNSNPQMFMQ